MSRGRPRRGPVAVSTLVGLLVALTGCGGSSSPAAAPAPAATTAASSVPSSPAGPSDAASSDTASGAPDSSAGSASGDATPAAGGATATKDDAIAATLPAAIKSKGTLVVATEGTYPPFELYAADNKTLIGVDPELAEAVATVLGLKIQFANTKFDSIIPGLQAKRFDAGMAAFGDTPAREKVVDFATYFKGGSTILIPKGNPLKLTIQTLCGKRLAVQKGTIYESGVVPDLNKACTGAGKPAIKSSVYPDSPQTILAVSSGRADATISDLAPLAYIAKNSNGKFEVLEEQYQSVPWGATMTKNSGLAEPFRAALQKLMDTGVYTAILQKWGVTSGAITTSVVNDAAG